MAGALFALLSCGSTKDVASVSSINGEWNIIEVSGTAVAPAGEELPFIDCNHMMRSFDVNAKPGGLAMAGTRMACPDMIIENNVLNALAQVKSYKKMDKSNIALCNASGCPVALLEKKAASVKC